MKKLFLIAGHHNNEPGATAVHPILGNLKEADLTKEVRDLLMLSLQQFNKDMAITKEDDGHTLAQVIKWLGTEMNEEDVMLDIHFNSFSNPQANGAETVIKNGSDENMIKLANAFSDTIAVSLEIKNRGSKTEAQSGRPKLGILHGKGTRIILEICFISNTADMDAYTKNKHILIDNLCYQIEKIMA